MAQVAVGSGQQAHAVAALLPDAVGVLEDGDARPVQVVGVDVDPLLGHGNLHPVVGAADHDRADRAHVADILALGGATVEPAFDGFGHGYGLRHSEADRGVDIHAVIGGLFDGLDAGLRDGHLHLHVGRQRVEVARLGNDGFAVAVVHGVGLDREAALVPVVALEGGLQEIGAAHGHLLDQLPRHLGLRPGRVLGDDGANPIFPQVHFLVEHVEHDVGVRRRAHGAMANGIGEFFDRAGVVPIIGRGRRDGLEQRTRHSDPPSHHVRRCGSGGRCRRVFIRCGEPNPSAANRPCSYKRTQTRI